MSHVPTLVRPTSAPARRPLPLRRKAAYSALLLVVFLLLVEGALRVRAWIKYGAAGADVSANVRIWDPELQMSVLRPGAEMTSPRFNVHVNSLGFRGGEIAPRKPPKTIRIVCLGASTTFCGEVADDLTWPARLQRLLQEKCPDKTVEVVNAAVPGYTSAECLKALKQKVLPLDPDLVVYYEANNEFAHDTRELAQERGLIEEGAGSVPRWAKAGAKVSLTFDLAYKNGRILLGRQDGTHGKLQGLPADLPTRFLSRLDAMRAELDARGVPLVLTTFAVKYRRDQDRETQLKNADVAFYYMPWMGMDDLLDAVDLYNEALLRYAKEHKLTAIDDRVALPGDAAHFVDCMHFSDAGCAKQAERVARGLLTVDAVTKKRNHR